MGDKAERPDGALDWKARLGGRAIRALMALLVATCRVRIVEGAEHLERLRSEGRPCVLAFWHDRLFYLTHFLYSRLVRRGYPLTVLISRSRDGDFGETLGLSLGAAVVRGSTSRGGPSALRGLLKQIRQGRSAVMVVDGPKGPRHQPKPGAVLLARLSGAPLVPLTWTASRTWRLGTWDRMEIPKPFSHIEVTVGDPIEVPREADEEGLARATQRLVRHLDR